MFIREDWTIFRNLNSITHKAGCRLKDLRGLVLKEIMDNALDAAPGKKPAYGESGSWYYIEDEGPGIPGTSQQIANLFSIKRPLTSTKILRRPSRGALGNGIRVIVGTILASGGQLRVSTRGKKLDLQLNDDGTTTIIKETLTEIKGTCIELIFGPGLPRQENEWVLAKLAANFNFALTYQGDTSAYWYDSDTFYELCLAAGDMSLSQLIGMFDGCGPNTYAGRQVRELCKNYRCSDITRETADIILGKMRETVKEISPRKIGRMIDVAENERCYARVYGEMDVPPGRGKYHAKLPYVVEAIAMERGKDGEEMREDGDNIIAMVNGTPITGDVRIERRGKGEVAVFGCGLRHKITRVAHRNFTVCLNVTVPYMPITTDGKEPDFSRLVAEISTVMQKSTRKLRKELRREVAKQTETLDRYLEKSLQKVSQYGKYRFSLRQLYYAMRPYVLENDPEKRGLDYGYFCRWVSQYENENGEIKGMYRDPRGTLYHPHTGETISIGTIAVEEYTRPLWTFNKILYIEKEGLFEVLKQVKFPERYDCALLSSKGFASRAVRDLIDLLGDHGEEIHVFAIHDADGPGTAIYEALVEETIARPSRKVVVHNLGMEPWEGMQLGLQVETFEMRKQRTTAAKYINRHQQDDNIDGDMDGYDWAEWLQENRIELNAMTSPQFVSWLEDKFKAIETKKVVPPNRVLEKTLKRVAEAKVRFNLTQKILAAADFESKVSEQMDTIIQKMPEPWKLKDQVEAGLSGNSAQNWTDPLDKVASKLVEG
jgi:hypothetical protein